MMYEDHRPKGNCGHNKVVHDLHDADVDDHIYDKYDGHIYGHDDGEDHVDEGDEDEIGKKKKKKVRYL